MGDKTMFETNPEWYTTWRGIPHVTPLLGFSSRAEFLTWVYGQELHPQIGTTMAEARVLDLGAGQANLTDDLIRDAQSRNAPLSVYAYDPYLKPARWYNHLGEELLHIRRVHTKDDVSRLRHHYPREYFDRIIASASYGLYATSFKDFMRQTLEVFRILKVGGHIRFVMLPETVTYTPRPDLGEDRMIVDVSQYRDDSNFLLESPHMRFRKVPARCLQYLSRLGFQYSLFPTFDVQDFWYVVCDAEKTSAGPQFHHRLQRIEEYRT